MIDIFLTGPFCPLRQGAALSGELSALLQQWAGQQELGLHCGRLPKCSLRDTEKRSPRLCKGPALPCCALSGEWQRMRAGKVVSKERGETLAGMTPPAPLCALGTAQCRGRAPGQAEESPAPEEEQPRQHPQQSPLPAAAMLAVLPSARTRWPPGQAWHLTKWLPGWPFQATERPPGSPHCHQMAARDAPLRALGQ